MAVFRVNKNKNYTVISNYHLRDLNLSLRAKGLLSVMYSLPDDWDYSIKGLAAICQEGEKAIRTILKELEETGYLVRTRTHNADGHFDGIIYDIFEQPNQNVAESEENQGFEPCAQKGHVEERHVDDAVVEQGTQLNTNILNKDLTNRERVEREPEDSSAQAKELIDEYNSICGWKLPKAIHVTEKRKKAIKARLKTYSREEIIKVFSLANESNFLCGDNDRGWKADIDWLLNENNMIKVLEGRYTNNAKSKNSWHSVNSSTRDKQYEEVEAVLLGRR